MKRKPDWADKAAMRCVPMQNNPVTYRETLVAVRRAIRAAEKRGFKRGYGEAQLYERRMCATHNPIHNGVHDPKTCVVCSAQKLQAAAVAIATNLRDAGAQKHGRPGLGDYGDGMIAAADIAENFGKVEK